MSTEEVANVLEFLQVVRPMDGVCRCEDRDFHAGRNIVEGFAQSLCDEKPQDMNLTHNGCANVLVFLRGIKVIDGCSYADGGPAHAGYNSVLRMVEAQVRRLGEQESVRGAILRAEGLAG